MTYTVKAPNKDYSGRNRSVEFRKGVGYTDDEALAETFRRKGWEVTKGGKGHEDAPPASVEPSTLGQAPHSRDAAVEGAAAAGPESQAFLAPIGAGEGKDPHGSEVVSPGLHGTPPAPVVGGEVPTDPEAQEAKEDRAAKAALIDNEPVPDGADHKAAPSVERPKDNASKDAWVSFAVAKGAARDGAETLSRKQLINDYGQEA